MNKDQLVRLLGTMNHFNRSLEEINVPVIIRDQTDREMKVLTVLFDEDKVVIVAEEE